MSHFTRMQTQMVEKAYVIRALADLGYVCEEGQVEIRGYSGHRTKWSSKLLRRTPAMT